MDGESEEGRTLSSPVVDSRNDRPQGNRGGSPGYCLGPVYKADPRWCASSFKKMTGTDRGRGRVWSYQTGPAGPTRRAETRPSLSGRAAPTRPTASVVLQRGAGLPRVEPTRRFALHPKTGGRRRLFMRLAPAGRSFEGLSSSCRSVGPVGLGRPRVGTGGSSGVGRSSRPISKERSSERNLRVARGQARAWRGRKGAQRGGKEEGASSSSTKVNSSSLPSLRARPQPSDPSSINHQHGCSGPSLSLLAAYQLVRSTRRPRAHLAP